MQHYGVEVDPIFRAQLKLGRVNLHIQGNWVTFSPGHVGQQVKWRKLNNLLKMDSDQDSEHL